jgi:DNA repair protein RecN (Recombination protein N)
MLTTLRIKNFALVDELTLELSPGYNVITGETGAGKSILIGALTLVLGERADRTLIRDGTDVCSVEAVFDVSGLRAPLREFLEENGLDACQDGQLILKRSVTAAGTNRQFVNGSPTALSTLAAVGEWLVDIHGPHDHQSLLQPARQLAILDAFGKLEAEVDAYAALLNKKPRSSLMKKAISSSLSCCDFRPARSGMLGLKPRRMSNSTRSTHGPATPPACCNSVK